jgi:CRP-like cAMP-binding protein
MPPQSALALPDSFAQPDNFAGQRGGVTPSNFLGQLSAEDYAELVSIARLKRFAKGEFVFSAGSPGETVYFLRQGQIKIGQLSPHGREVILWFCLPGEIFGLAEVARGGGRVVHAQACEDSEVLAVSQEEFKVFLERHTRLALLSMQVLSSRLRVLGEMFINLVADDVDTRIAKLILRLGARYGTRSGKDILLNIPLTHQEIADMVGTTRQTVTGVLGRLRRQGVLSIENHRILIESEEFLNEMSQGGSRPGEDSGAATGH